MIRRWRAWRAQARLDRLPPERRLIVDELLYQNERTRR